MIRYNIFETSAAIILSSTVTMKTLLYVTLGALLACPVLVNAQSTNAAPSGPPPGDGGGWHHGPKLTDAERAELKKAHDEAATANPDLFKQQDDLRAKMKADRDSGDQPDPSLFTQMKTLHEQTDAAMIKADPAVAPILAKLKAGHHPHGPGGPDGGAGGPPPPPDSGT